MISIEASNVQKKNEEYYIIRDICSMFIELNSYKRFKETLELGCKEYRNMVNERPDRYIKEDNIYKTSDRIRNPIKKNLNNQREEICLKPKRKNEEEYEKKVYEIRTIKHKSVRNLDINDSQSKSKQKGKDLLFVTDDDNCTIKFFCERNKDQNLTIDFQNSTITKIFDNNKFIYYYNEENYFIYDDINIRKFIECINISEMNKNIIEDAIILKYNDYNTNYSYEGLLNDIIYILPGFLIKKNFNLQIERSNPYVRSIIEKCKNFHIKFENNISYIDLFRIILFSLSNEYKETYEFSLIYGYISLEKIFGEVDLNILQSNLKKPINNKVILDYKDLIKQTKIYNISAFLHSIVEANTNFITLNNQHILSKNKEQLEILILQVKTLQLKIEKMEENLYQEKTIYDFLNRKTCKESMDIQNKKHHNKTKKKI